MTGPAGTDPVTVEIGAIARLLRVQPGTLGYLTAVPAGDLRALRLRARDVITRANADGLGRIASIATIIPPPIAARMVVRSGGSLFAARLAEAMAPSRAMEIGRRLPVSMLADIATDLDPGPAMTIIGGLPGELLRAVVAELSAREQWLTLAEFAEQEFSRDQFDAMIGGAPPIALLHIGFLIYDRDRLALLTRQMSAEVATALAGAAAEYEAWPEFVHIVGAMEPGIAADAVRTARALPPEVRAGAAAAVPGGLFDEPLPSP